MRSTTNTAAGLSAALALMALPTAALADTPSSTHKSPGSISTAVEHGAARCSSR